MLFEHFTNMSSDLTIAEDLLGVFPDKVWNGYAPDAPLGDAPLVEVIEFFGDVQVVRADILAFSSFLQLFSVFSHLLAVLKVECGCEFDRGELLETLELELVVYFGEP